MSNAMTAPTGQRATGLFAPDAAASKPAEPFTVKNTFIEIDNEFFEEADSMSSLLNTGSAKRQVSEPAFVFGRQCSSRPPLVPLQEEPEKKGSEDGGLTSSDIEEPETEIEPAERQVTYQQWATSIYAPENMLSATVAPWPEVWAASADMSMGMEAMSGNPMGVLASASVQACESVPADWGETTTVMMRNLPNRYTQQMLLEEVTESGFAGMFDFFYLPIDPETQANKGYAFINFLDNVSSWRFKAMFEGKQMSRFNSSKFVSVSAAALQGLTANYAHYSTARCSRGDPAARPLFLREPQQGLGRGRGASGSRRGGARRRNSGRSLVDVAAAKQSETVRSVEDDGFGAEEQAGSAELSQSKDKSDSSRVAKFCPFCGGATQPSYKFCQFCGASQATVSDVDNLMGA